MGKAKREVHGDVVPSWIENDSLFLSEKETFTLINEFRNQDESAVIPCFLSWLYYGKSFETMVDRLKDVLLEHDTFKWIFKSLTRIIVSVSIKNHFREIKDWEEYIKDECNASIYVNDITKNAIEDALASLTEESVNICHLSSEQNSVLAEEASPTEVPDYTNHSAMTQIAELKDKPKQSDSSCKMKLEDYLICDDKVQVIDNIKSILSNKSEGPYQAYIYVALQELQYLNKCNGTKFHEALESVVPHIELRTKENFHAALRKIFSRKVGVLVPHSLNNTDRKQIEHIKDILTNKTKTNEETSKTAQVGDIA